MPRLSSVSISRSTQTLIGSLGSRALVVTATVALLLASPGQATPPGMEHVDPSWIESWEFEMERQLQMMESAYALDADAMATLRQEMQNRLLEQWNHDQESDREMQDLLRQIEESGTPADDENSPLVQKLNERLLAQTESMPLNEMQIATWLEQRLPPAVATQGRARLEELRTRHLLMMATQEYDSEMRASLKSSLQREAKEMTAEVPAEFNRPVPPAEIVEYAEARDRMEKMQPYVEPMRPRAEARGSRPEQSPQFVPPTVPHPQPQAQPPVTRPEHQAAKPAPEPISPPRPVVNPQAQPPQQKTAAPPPLQPAPPLDDWEKYVLSVAAKYEFDESQTTNARSILSDLRRRAYQYQASRAEDFARTELMTDAKARTEELKNLNRPLDALFEELKQRLESLPTISQRQKAGSAAPAGRK